ncbi:hypothetical protein PROAA_3260002 [Candidatus Propionivibrio aalborgensis]|uniref:Uncharacterized protein n=2 Tax=Candidatus Propionivibrio aalborgensis TaxID=1860101 RepID=A0A1A8XZL2_9RHOO|nr:hypothetical protein PROAA_3260002 [Candidatus Propionivibrio aalborgensis]
MEDGGMKFEGNNLFSIDPEHVRRIRLAIGVMALVLAIFNLFFGDPITLSTGRWSWVYRMITELFGIYGYPIFQATIGVACIAWSRRKSSNT